MTKYILFLSLSLVACTSVAKESRRFLVLTTDFGLKDGAVSAMKGVAYGAAPEIEISDLTHEIPPYDIWQAAYRLQQTYSYWPSGTVFVTVVDPGVGSARKPVVVKLRSGHYFVGPDNGHLTLLQDQVEAVRWIDETHQRRQGSEQSYTFHGRDLFGLVGAKLTAGLVKFEEVGPVATVDLVQLPYQKPALEKGELRGLIPVLDPNYGNVWTNIPKEMLKREFPEAKILRVTIKKRERVIYSARLPLVDTFSGVAKGQPLLYFNSLLNLSLALNQGSFAEKHKIGSGAEWTIQVRP